MECCKWREGARAEIENALALEGFGSGRFWQRGPKTKQKEGGGGARCGVIISTDLRSWCCELCNANCPRLMKVCVWGRGKEGCAAGGAPGTKYLVPILDRAGKAGSRGEQQMNEGAGSPGRKMPYGRLKFSGRGSRVGHPCSELRRSLVLCRCRESGQHHFLLLQRPSWVSVTSD